MESEEGTAQPMPPSPRPDTLAPVTERNGRSTLALSGTSADLIMLQEPASAAAEAFRSLSASLQFGDPERPLRCVGLTSAGTREDTASAVGNLAVAMAEGGRRVIAVDADVRQPSLHTLFGVSNQVGLTSAVLDGADDVPLAETGVPRLHLLPSGPSVPNPVEVLGAPRLVRLLDLLRDQADVVVVNTAPAAALADTAVLAPHLDGMLLVISAGHTRRDLALRAKEQLERVNARVLGVVLTGVRAERGLYGD
jgi:non-specific protein-tyrosine kinase